LVVTHPDNSKNWQLLSDVQAANKKWREADQSMLQAIRLNPSSYELYESLGHYAAMAGESARAIAAFQKAIALNPKAPFANLNLAIASENDGEYKAAASRYLLAVEGGLTSDRQNIVNAALSGLHELQKATQSTEIATLLKTAITLSNQPRRTQQ
jgi:tetratricopeptide (TPR) repeat protein